MDDIKQKIEARMLNGQPFTYGDLCAELKTAGRDVDRKIDQTIQKLRKKGRIAFQRINGRVVWAATGE